MAIDIDHERIEELLLLVVVDATEKKRRNSFISPRVDQMVISDHARTCERNDEPELSQ